MCWFTMLRRPELAHFGEPCDNFASCLDPIFGTNISDPRTDDSVPFACAFYSFCPDPCCTAKHLTSLQSCYESPENPCLEARSRNQPDVRMETPLCKVEHTSNQDLSGLQQGHWNLSCPCPDIGYEWDSRANACVDIDECTRGGKAAIEATLPCGGPEVSSCFNLPGRAGCVCHWGYSWNPAVRRCKADSTLPDFFSGKSII
ncbi:hypothetical protein B566_EDAN002865 [Ephemera danica]|nr:hypothetical protein B566_EDAN002865 [Ephemera danica]